MGVRLVEGVWYCALLYGGALGLKVSGRVDQRDYSSTCIPAGEMTARVSGERERRDVGRHRVALPCTLTYGQAALYPGYTVVMGEDAPRPSLRDLTHGRDSLRDNRE